MCYSLLNRFIFFVLSSEDTMVKEKLWTLISQNEPSLVHINMVIFSV